MTIKNNNIGDKNRKISGKKIMLVTALLSGGVVIRVNNHINNSFGHVPKEVINFDLTLESTDVLIDDSGVFYVGQGTPIDNFNIYDFVTILDESGNVIADKDVTLEWDVKEYFEGTTFGTEGEYLITITATTADGRTGELEYKLVVKEGHIFEEIKEIGDVEIEQTHTKDYIDFQEHFRVLNSATGEETLTNIESTLEDEDLRTLGTKQVIFYTELNGTRFTNSVDISVVDTVAPVIELEDSFNNDFEWDQKGRTINISDLDKALSDFSLDQFATAYDASGEYELSWNFEEVMTGKMDEIGTYTVTITAVDSSGNERIVEIYVNISTVKIEFKDGISEVAFELYYDAKIEDAKYKVGAFYNIYDAGGNLVADHRISWTLTEEMVRELGTYRVTIEVLDDNDQLIGSKGIEVKVQDTLAPVAVLMPGVSSTFDIEVNQNMSVDNLFMYLDGVSGIDELISVTENSGVWGYRFLYRDEQLTDTLLQTIGVKAVTLQLFDYDIDGNETNITYLTDANGNEISLTFNVQDTTDPTVNVVNDIINLEVMQSATKEMIEITNYAEISDNSGTFTWDLRVKGSQDDVMDYEDMLGKITPDLGVVLELVVTDASGNTTYSDITLIVTDNEAPVIEVRKDTETININPSASEMLGYRNMDNYVRVSDNSGRYDLEWDFDTVVNTTVSGVYYVTVTAQDDAGNTTEEVITFTVIDEEAPTIIVNTKSIEVEANEYMNVAEFEFDENLNDYITVSDNSGVKQNVTFDYSNVDFSELGVYEVIITATDNANNSAINIIEIKVIAGNPKVNLVEGEIIDTIGIDSQNQISGIKAVVKDGKIIVEKANSDSDEDELFTYLTIEDLLEFLTISGEEIVSSTWDMDLINLQLVGTKDVTLNVTNNFGKTTTMVIEVVVINEWDSELKLKDGVENFIDLQIDITDTNRDVAWFKSTYDVKDYVDYRTTGNPDDLEWSINSIDFNKVGSTVITITMNDGTNIYEVSLNLNIIDTTKPVFTIIKDTEAVEINTDDASGFSITDFVTVSDNGDVAPTLSWNLSSQVDFGKSGTYTVTIKAVDASGNESTQEITFDIGDNTKPVITINAGMDIQTFEINSREESQFNINSFVTATDNSGVAPELEWDIESVDFATVGTNTVTIKAKDDAGNEAIEVTVEFIIVDTIAPTIDIDASGLDELKIEIDTKSESDYSDWLEDYVTVTDNSGETIKPTWNISSVNFDTVGSYKVVIEAEDKAGNISTVNVVFAVADTTAPTITLKDNMETTEYEVFNQLGTNLSIDDFATCDDATNCIMSWDMSSVNFDRVGTYIVTIKAVDMYGNESIKEITIEVIDTVAPVIEITRADILVSMGKFTSSDFDVNDFAKVTDNYDNSVVLTWDIDSVDFDSEGVYTVTISAIDSSGNEAVEATVEFEVQDNGMILTEESPFVIEVDTANEATDFNVATYFTATREDGSAVENTTWNLTDDMVTTYGTHGVTLTITFDNGTKTVEIEVTLEVVDNTPPVITPIKSSETIELGASTVFDGLTPEDFASVTDNSNQVSLSWDFDNIVEQTVAGTYSVTITATDVAGNTEVETIDIIVEDTAKPTLELNDDFDRNNMTWSKGTSELSILAGDKAPGEIDLWELVTATDLSTAGLTISWDLADAELDQVDHYPVEIKVSDASGNFETVGIIVNVLRATPILNDFNVDKSYNEIIVDVDITNINQAISELKIILLDSNGVQITEYDQDLTTPLDALTINQVFNVNSNTEYKVVLEYTYATLADNSDAKTITDTKDVKTLAYSQNDVLGTISDTYVKHTEIIVNYEINNDLGLMTTAELVLLNHDGTATTIPNAPIDIDEQTGTHTFASLPTNTNYKVVIEISYDFNDGNNVVDKVGASKDVKTLAYTEHDVITDITGITQSPSTISVDYNITDIYDLILTTGMTARIYKADDMINEIDSLPLVDLNGTVQFTGLNANTQYVIVIETSLDLTKDGTEDILKKSGTQTTTESYSVDEIVVNVENIIVEHNNIKFDYSIFDASSLLSTSTTPTGAWLLIDDGNTTPTKHNLTILAGTVDLSNIITVLSGTNYDIQIHFEYNLKDGQVDQTFEEDDYSVSERTFEYNVDQDLTLTSHNLASDTKTIYVDYSLRNLNGIGDMSTLMIKIDDLNGNSEEILLSAIFGDVASIPLEGSIAFYDINNSLLAKNTEYEITITIDYDLSDGNSVQQGLLLLDRAEIKTTDVALGGYDIISSVDRGYTTLEVDFDIENLNDQVDLSTLKIALLDENRVVAQDFVSVGNAHTGSGNTFLFENLLSDATYTVVFRVDHPLYGIDNSAQEFIEIERRTSTRKYDVSLIDVDYTLSQGLTFLHLENIEITNGNEVFENIDYSSVIVVATYLDRDGNIVTKEIDLGSLTEGEQTEAVFSGIQSNTDVKLEFKLEYDLKDGNGIQTGTNEIVRSSDAKTLEYDFTFVIENDEAVVTGLTPGFNDTHLVIFAEVEGYPVKHIRSDAFYGDSISITEITIPRTLETIGDNAFRNVSLTTVNLTNVFEVIPTVTGLFSTTQPDGALIIGDNAFRDNNIVSFDFTTTDTIGTNAFRSNLFADVTLNDNISYVGQESFANNVITKLATGKLLSDENFGIDSFVGNSISELTIGNVGFKHYSLGTSKSVFDNNGFKLIFASTATGKIEDLAWRTDVNDPLYSDVNITDLVIGDGIEELGLSSFYGNMLNVVEIGDNVHTIGAHAFRNTGISQLIFTENTSITEIQWRAFENNNLTSVTLPKTLETIGYQAFINNKITELVIPDTVTYIGNNAFENNLITKLEVGSLLSDENFGTDSFVGNSISELTIGNVGFKHDSLGTSKEVFNNAGFKLIFSDKAVGDIEVLAWRTDPTDPLYSDVNINDLVIGNGIEEIGLSAFMGNSLTKVEIGDSVHTIGAHAFRDTGISQLIFTEDTSITEIQWRAFENNNLTSVTLPKTLETIGYQAFINNRITELVIPDTVSFIDRNAFENNLITKLTVGSLLSDENFGDDTFVGNSIAELSIGNVGFRHDSLGTSKSVFNNAGFKLTFSDSAIGNIDILAWKTDPTDPLYSDVNITELEIGNGIEEIGLSAFMGNSLTKVEIGDSVHTIGAHAFRDTGISQLIFTENTSITEIQWRAFENNKLTSLTLPKTLETIGYQAFINNRITELVIPDTVSFIDRNAFENNLITKLTVGELLSDENFGVDTFIGNSISELTIGNTGFKYNSLGLESSVFSNSGYKLVIGDTAVGVIDDQAWRYGGAYSTVQITSLEIGNGIQSIGSNSFSGNVLSKVEFGDALHTIGYRAFEGSSVNEVIFSPTGIVREISSEAFANNGLTSIILPNTLEELGEKVFFNNKISEVSIPDSVTKIGKNSFEDNMITKVTLGSGLKEIDFGTNIFIGNDISEVISSVSWLKFDSLGTPGEAFDSLGIDLTFTNSAIGTIEDNAWRYGTGYLTVKVNTISLGSGIEEIGVSAFEGNNITNLVFGDNLTTLGESAFKGNSISTYPTGGKVQSLPANIFEDNSFVNLVIPESINFVGEGAFKNNQITTFTMSSNVNEFSNSVFENNSIANLVIPTQINALGNASFKGNEITSITFNGKITTISESSFEDNSLTALVIPAEVTNIGNSAFAGNEIDELDIPSSIRVIGNNAFEGNQMTKLILQANITENIFGTNTFIGNEISELQISDVGIKHNTFGNSDDVFNSLGFKLVIKDEATGKIADNAWEYSTSTTTSNVKLTNITIGNGIDEIGNSSFLGNNLNTVVIGDNVEVIGESAFASTGISNLTLGLNLETIMTSAFANNKSITNVIFPDKLETIGASAFYNNGFQTLVLPNSVDYIGDNAFESNGMTTLTIGQELSDENFGNDSFINNSISELTIGNVGFKHNSLGTSKSVFNNAGFKLTFAEEAVGLIEDQAWRYDAADPLYSDVQVTSVDIGDGITEIGISAFLGNSLTKVEFGDNILKIGGHAFRDTGLTSVVFSDNSSVSEIAHRTFEGNRLTTIDLPETLKIIGYQAFMNNSLTELELPEAVESLGRNSFEGNSLTKVKLGSKIDETLLGEDVFIGNSINDLTISSSWVWHDSFGASKDVFSSSGFNLTFTSLTRGGTIDQAWRYDGGTSYSARYVKKLTFEEGIESLGISAFFGNPLGSIVLPDSIVNVGSNTFRDTDLTSVTLGNYVVDIASSAFKDNSLTSIVLPSTLQSIGYQAFYGNSALKSVQFLGGTVIGSENFDSSPTFKDANGNTIT